jgi:hypothetical protein
LAVESEKRKKEDSRRLQLKVKRKRTEGINAEDTRSDTEDVEKKRAELRVMK